MKKLLKIMAVVFVMVMMCGVAVSANTAINPTQITTGTEDINTIPERTYSYNASTSYSIKGGQYVGGNVIPITIPAPGTVYFNFTQNQSISASANVELWSDLNGTKGWSISNPYSTSSLQNKLVKVDVNTAGTYYIVMYTNKYNIPKLTTNTISFKTYFVNAAYSAPDQVIQSGQTLPLIYGSGTKYYQISVPQAGHITVASNVKQYIDICNSAKGSLYTSVNLDPAANSGVASFYLDSGVYYIAAKGSYNADISALKYVFYPLGSEPFYVNTKEEVVTMTPGSYQNYHYIEYRAPYNGYVMITAQSGSGYATLLKSNKKKALSSEDYFNATNANNNRLTYGVKAGTTYYFRIKSYDDVVSLKIKSAKISEKSGSSKKKAVTVKRNKTKKGYIQAGSNTADWYKFKVTKSRKTRIYINGGTNDRFKVTVYKSNGKSMGSGYVQGTPCKNTFVFKRGAKEVKLAKGTYYIKIQRYNKKSSGYYTLKWK